METIEPGAIPQLLSDFLLTLVMSFLLGLGLREYYSISSKTHVFGSTRTCTFIGLLGFVLFDLQESGWIYLGGLFFLSLILGFYYLNRLDQQQTGLIGILIAMLCYAVGPIALKLPDWFLVLFTISTLFILNAKEKIRTLTQHLANEEIITLAKFLVLSGVILPLTPNEPIAEFIPVSPHQTWMAVVVISGISYSGYLIQTYVMKGQGILLTGAIGGIYSSTATTVVTARQSQFYPRSTEPAAAIVLATAVMYLRLLVVVAIFNLQLCLLLLPAFMVLAALAGGMVFLLRKGNHASIGSAAELNRPQNPLEINSALVFAVLFMIVTAATHFIIGHYAHRGLQWMSFFAGFTDIDPFVLSLLQGKFSVSQVFIAKAIVIATASNNLLKAAYTIALAEKYTARRAGLALLSLAGLTLAYGFM